MDYESAAILSETLGKIQEALERMVELKELELKISQGGCSKGEIEQVLGIKKV